MPRGTGMGMADPSNQMQMNKRKKQRQKHPSHYRDSEKTNRNQSIATEQLVDHFWGIFMEGKERGNSVNQPYYSIKKKKRKRTLRRSQETRNENTPQRLN